jgi:hypothetical protein
VVYAERARSIGVVERNVWNRLCKFSNWNHAGITGSGVAEWGHHITPVGRNNCDQIWYSLSTSCRRFVEWRLSLVLRCCRLCQHEARAATILRTEEMPRTWKERVSPDHWSPFTRLYDHYSVVSHSQNLVFCLRAGRSGV